MCQGRRTETDPLPSFVASMLQRQVAETSFRSVSSKSEAIYLADEADFFH